MKLITRISKLIKTVKQELNRVVTRVRVFSNCLLLYFENGSPRFYSKKGEDWGSTGSDYFVTEVLSEMYNKMIEDALALLAPPVIRISDHYLYCLCRTN